MSYWICQLSGWGLFTLLKIIASVEVADAPWLSMTLTFVMLHGAGLGLTHALRDFMRRHHWSESGAGRLVRRSIAASFVLAIPLAVATSLSPVATVQGPTLSQIHLPTVLNLDLLPGLAILAVNLINWAFLFMVWLAIYFTTIAIRNHQAAALRQSEMARALQQAELRLLKSQLNPHFLFNALNTVRALIAEDTAKAQRAVTRLANTLRYTLGAGQHELVSFERELEMVSDFLELEKMRFEDRLTIERQVAPGLGSTRIPAMLLQTVVENAIKHGIAELPAGGLLRIRADLEDGALVLQVENPRPLTVTRPLTEGTGLRNAEERLRLLFNSGASLELDLSKPAMATTRIRIPQHSHA
ncbi:MAG TPA: histidine kinase [Steroidobacteraceae bacterium]